MESRELRKFCQEHLPRFSKQVDLGTFDFPSRKGKDMPQVLLLSTKKETPVIWRVVSGLYRKRLAFYDSEVHDVSDSAVKKLKVDKLPAIVGVLPSGEKHILSSGVVVKDVKSGVEEIGKLLDKFEAEYKKAASQRSALDSAKEDIMLLTKTSLHDLCGEKITVCIIGVFRTQKTMEKIASILSTVSQKRMTRRQSSTHDIVSYSLLDASKQSSFLYSFDKSGFKSFDGILVAYKPRKERFAVYSEDVSLDTKSRILLVWYLVVIYNLRKSFGVLNSSKWLSLHPVPPSLLVVLRVRVMQILPENKSVKYVQQCTGAIYLLND